MYMEAGKEKPNDGGLESYANQVYPWKVAL